MEEQKIINSTEPRFTLKKGMKETYSWDIALSSPDEKEKLEELINIAIGLHDKVEKRFPEPEPKEKKKKGKMIKLKEGED